MYLYPSVGGGLASKVRSTVGDKQPSWSNLCCARLLSMGLNSHGMDRIWGSDVQEELPNLQLLEWKTEGFPKVPCQPGQPCRVPRILSRILSGIDICVFLSNRITPV